MPSLSWALIANICNRLELLISSIQAGSVFPFREVNDDMEMQPEKRIDTENAISLEIALWNHVKRNMKGSEAGKKRVFEVG